MEFLKELGIADKNYGASTGLNWYQSVDSGVIDVVSPVDGKSIAKVYQCSEKDYEDVFPRQMRHSSIGGRFQLRDEVRLFAA
jgi:acyl-CoA reductase-like NAD-dependent aldehyde dehydrogenase